MRKVLFKKWIPAEKIKSECGFYTTTKSGTRCWEADYTHEGTFHEWGLAVNGDDQAYTVAIVELSNGQITEVLPSNVKFLEPIKTIK